MDLLPSFDENLLPPPEEPIQGNLITAGNKKIFLRWNNNFFTGEAERTKIYHNSSLSFSSDKFPFINDDGVSNSDIIFEGLLIDDKFVHRDLQNDNYHYYSIVNTDKYGRISNILNAFVKPSAEADESTIPLIEVSNLRYEIFDDESVSIIWDQPVKEQEKINAFFDQTVFVYATITDEFGQPVPEDALAELIITPNIIKETSVDDVFTTGEPVSFSDSDVYSFSVYNIQDGIIKSILRMTDDDAILSQIKEVIFTLQIKSVLKNNNGDNIFEYFSTPITVNFTNPWEIEIVNRDSQTVKEKCYTIKTNEITKRKNLIKSYVSFDGIYVRSSTPFIARVKLRYKGEPVPSGSIDIAVWDAEANLCSCAGIENCEYKGDKISQSTSVLPPASSLPIIYGFEEDGTTTLSYVDIPLSSPDVPQSVLLYVKGKRAGFSSRKDLYIVFQNILQIDISSNSESPVMDGVDKKELQSIATIINPDHPDDKTFNTYPSIDDVDFPIVQWGIVPIKGGNSRDLYSVDNVSLTNGVFSNLRNGVARNVFFGPFNADNEDTDETHEISATIVHEGLTATSKQWIDLGFKIRELDEFGARFLMEMQYPIDSAKIEENKLWMDGIDYVKGFICHSPEETSIILRSDNRSWIYGDKFNSCANAEDEPILQLSEGQEVIIDTGDDNFEVLWGEISEQIDEYTNRPFLKTGGAGFSSQRFATISLGSDPSNEDIDTVFYIRANKFLDKIDSCDPNSECDKESSINLNCMDLNDCNLPGGNTFITGITTLYINNEPVELQGGGDMFNGVPPCPICLKEPLSISLIWTRVDEENTLSLGDFFDEDQNSLVKHDSDIDIKVKISFSGLPVPNGTRVRIILGKSDGNSLFVPSNTNIITNIENDGNSYANISLAASRMPSETTDEVVTIYTDYDENNKTERRKEINLLLRIENNPVALEDEEEDEDPGEIETQIVIPTPYSNNVERYNVINDEWEIISSMIERKGDVFIGTVGEKVYVLGGVKDNNHNISLIIEELSFTQNDPSLVNPSVPINDGIWVSKTGMNQPRFGGMSITIDDNIYTIGGIKRDESGKIEVSRDVEVYYPLLDFGGGYEESWETLSSMPIVDEEKFNEEYYGVAYGVAEHTIIGSKNYIYILCGITKITTLDNIIKPFSYNDRILRYCIEDDIWENSDKLYNTPAIRYKRFSASSFIYNNYIYVFNGDIEDDNKVLNYPDPFRFEIQDNLNNNILSAIGMGIIPIDKSRSSIVKYDESPSTQESLYYILGGNYHDEFINNPYYLTLRNVETLNTNIIKFSYNNLQKMPFYKSGAGATLVDIGTPYIIIAGGFTNGRATNQIFFGDI